MARPRKQKRVYRMPERTIFGPIDGTKPTLEINMLIEEYETIRLIDFERLNQEECALAMNVARATVQRLYDTARIKISKSLVTGATIIIGGGDYLINEDYENSCGRGCGRGNGPRDGRGFGQRHSRKINE